MISIDDISDSLQCCCCRRIFTDPRTLECAHSYCSRCCLSLAMGSIQGLQRGKIRCPLRCARHTELLSVSAADMEMDTFAISDFDVLDVAHPERLERALDPNSRALYMREKLVVGAVLRLPKSHALGEICLKVKKQLVRQQQQQHQQQQKQQKQEEIHKKHDDENSNSEIACEICDSTAETLNVCDRCGAILCAACAHNEANEHSLLCASAAFSAGGATDPASPSSLSPLMVGNTKRLLLPAFLEPKFAVKMILQKNGGGSGRSSSSNDSCLHPVLDVMPFVVVTVRVVATTSPDGGSIAAPNLTAAGAPPFVSMQYRVFMRRGVPSRVEPLLPSLGRNAAAVDGRLLADLQSLLLACLDLLHASLQKDLPLLVSTLNAFQESTSSSPSKGQTRIVVVAAASLFASAAMMLISLLSNIIVPFCRCVLVASHIMGLNQIETQREAYREQRSNSSTGNENTTLEEAMLLRLFAKQTHSSCAVSAECAVVLQEIVLGCAESHLVAQEVLASCQQLLMVNDSSGEEQQQQKPPVEHTPADLIIKTMFPELAKHAKVVVDTSLRVSELLEKDSKRWSSIDVGNLLNHAMEKWNGIVLGTGQRGESGSFSNLAQHLACECVPGDSNASLKKIVGALQKKNSLVDQSYSWKFLEELDAIRRRHSQMLLELSALPCARFSSRSPEEIAPEQLPPELMAVFQNVLASELGTCEDISKKVLIKHVAWAKVNAMNLKTPLSSSSSSSSSFLLLEKSVASLVAACGQATSSSDSRAAQQQQQQQEKQVVRISRANPAVTIPLAALNSSSFVDSSGVSSPIGGVAEKLAMKRFLADFDTHFFIPSEAAKQSAAKRRDAVLSAAAAKVLTPEEDNASEASSTADDRLNQQQEIAQGVDSILLAEEHHAGGANENDVLLRAERRRAALRHFRTTRFAASAVSAAVCHEPFALCSPATQGDQHPSPDVVAISLFSAKKHVLLKEKRNEEEQLRAMEEMVERLQQQEDDEPEAPPMEVFEHNANPQMLQLHNAEPQQGQQVSSNSGNNTTVFLAGIGAALGGIAAAIAIRALLLNRRNAVTK